MAARSSESPYRRQQAILIRKAIPELSVWATPAGWRFACSAKACGSGVVAPHG